MPTTTTLHQLTRANSALRASVATALATAAAVIATASCSPTARTAQSTPQPAGRTGGASDYDRMLSVAESYARAGRAERSAHAAEEATRADPNRPEAYVVWGRALAELNDLPAAAAQYEEARRRGSRDPKLFAELASIFDVTHRYDDALAVYRDYLTDHPTDAEMRQQLGLTLLLVGHAPEGAKELEAASKAAPGNVQVLQDWGFALLRAGQPEAASQVLEQVLAAESDRLDAMRFIAQAFALQGDATQALSWLDRAIAQSPRDSEALRLRGRLKAMTGDGDGAVADYGALAQLLAHGDEAWRELLAVAQKAKDKKLEKRARAAIETSSADAPGTTSGDAGGHREKRQ